LAAAPLAGHAVVFCVNLPAPDTATAARLREYVGAGGHLFWVCGPNVEPDAYIQMNAEAAGNLLPVPLGASCPAGGTGDAGRHVAALDRTHPALAPLAEPAALYQSVLVHRYFACPSGPESGARVLARLDDGRPLLLERGVGAGSVLLLTTAVQGGWTNLPLRPLFLPLVARLTFHLAGAEVERGQVTVGAPLVVPLGRQAGRPEVEVVRPSGEVLRVHDAEAGAPVFRYADTHEPGVYLLRVLGGPPGREFVFAVNVDPEECDPAVLTPAELKERFGRRPLVVCEAPEGLAGTVRRLREGTGLGEVFLAAVLAGLVLETLLANRRLPARAVPGVNTTASAASGSRSASARP
jgi:hypothetical protein